MFFFSYLKIEWVRVRSQLLQQAILRSSKPAYINNIEISFLKIQLVEFNSIGWWTKSLIVYILIQYNGLQ